MPPYKTLSRCHSFCFDDCVTVTSRQTKRALQVCDVLRGETGANAITLVSGAWHFCVMRQKQRSNLRAKRRGCRGTSSPTSVKFTAPVLQRDSGLTGER